MHTPRSKHFCHHLVSICRFVLPLKYQIRYIRTACVSRAHPCVCYCRWATILPSVCAMQNHGTLSLAKMLGSRLSSGGSPWSSNRQVMASVHSSTNGSFSKHNFGHLLKFITLLYNVQNLLTLPMSSHLQELSHLPLERWQSFDTQVYSCSLHHMWYSLLFQLAKSCIINVCNIKKG
jgi:hypothetical protein